MLLLLRNSGAPATKGFRSFLAFWMGGGAIVVATAAKNYIYYQMMGRR